MAYRFTVLAISPLLLCSYALGKPLLLNWVPVFASVLSNSVNLGNF
jgi:hypothetical protein